MYTANPQEWEKKSNWKQILTSAEKWIISLQDKLVPLAASKWVHTKAGK
jgi:hypothetical protein